MELIQSNDTGSVWHVSKIIERRGDISGKLLGRYVVTACTSRQLGGVWGHSTHNLYNGIPKNICKACAKLLHKQHGIALLGSQP